MPQVDNHLKWCLKDTSRLEKVRPDAELAKKHLSKSEYNSEVMAELEKLKRYDWALNIGFYSIYHCFLAILAKFGYSSKNQSCTITVMLKLIEEKKIDMDKDFVLQFDTLDPGKLHTIRHSRETSTYGVKSEIGTDELKQLKNLIVMVQKQTILIIS